MRFLCIDPRHDGGRPTAELVHYLGYGGVRFVVFPERFNDVAYYLNSGLKVQMVLARESGPVEAFADWFATDDPGLQGWFRENVFWVIGNEPDAYGGHSSWIMNPEEYWQLWQRARKALPSHLERWVAGQCSGDITRSKWYAQEDMTGIVVHPYAKTPQEAVALVFEYANYLNAPVWVGEFEPHPNHDSSNEPYWQAFAEHGIWANEFCFSDAMVPGFGMEDAA